MSDERFREISEWIKEGVELAREFPDRRGEILESLAKLKKSIVPDDATP